MLLVNTKRSILYNENAPFFINKNEPCLMSYEIPVPKLSMTQTLVLVMQCLQLQDRDQIIQALTSNGFVDPDGHLLRWSVPDNIQSDYYTDEYKEVVLNITKSNTVYDELYNGFKGRINHTIDGFFFEHVDSFDEIII